MKKILPLLIAALSLLMVSCKPSTQEIAQKIVEGSELSQKDYTFMLEQTSKTAEAINDTISKYGNDFTAMANALRSMAAENPDMNILVEKVLTMDPSTLDESNRKLYDNAIKLIASVQDNAIQVGGAAVHVANPAVPEEADAKAEVADDNTLTLDSVHDQAKKLTEDQVATPAGNATEQAK